MSHEAASNRRAFLARTPALAAAVPILAMGASASAQQGIADAKPRGRKNRGKPLPELYRNWDERNFREIQADENAHVDAITRTIAALGGVVPPAPTFNDAALQPQTYHAFAVLSQTFENTGVMAYLGALPFIESTDLKTAAGSIALVEAYHSGFLNTLLNTPIVPNASPFASPATQGQIVQAVNPFIASLNAPLPAIGATPSPANDIAILQFALILERLEARFYNLNVPNFFG